MENFFQGRSIDEIFSLIVEHNENISSVERYLGVRRDALSHQIRNRRNLPIFKKRFPTKFKNTNINCSNKHESSGSASNYMEILFVDCYGMVNGKPCPARVPVQVVRGSGISRGFKKRCHNCQRIIGNIEAGCIATGGAELNQIANW